MGSPENEWGRGLYTEDQVAVTLTHAFWLQQYEMSQEIWTSAGLPNPSGVNQFGGDCSDPQCPVGNVTWFEAIAFANMLSQKHDPPLSPCYELIGCTGSLGKGMKCTSAAVTAQSVYECDGFRLPTEAEWEYAVRSGTRTAFYSGEITPQPVLGTCYADSNLDDIAWYCFNSADRTHPRGGKQPNGWLLYDMPGNAEEWVHDHFTGTTSPGPLADPMGELDAEKSTRLTRGGGYNAWSSVLRSASALYGPWWSQGPGLGFRLARTIMTRDGGP